MNNLTRDVDNLIVDSSTRAIESARTDRMIRKPVRIARRHEERLAEYHYELSGHDQRMTVVFKSLGEAELRRILDLGQVQQRIMISPSEKSFVFTASDSAKEFLLKARIRGMAPDI